jgi:hypothetical protein
MLSGIHWLYDTRGCGMGEGAGGGGKEDNFRNGRKREATNHGCGNEGYGNIDIYQELSGWKTVDSTYWLTWAKLLDDFKDGIVYVALDVV